MRGWATGLLILGVLVALGSLLMDTTVFSPGVPSIGGFGGIEGGRTHNLGLLQTQELLFIGGCTLFLAGAVLAGAAAIVEAVGGVRSPAPHSDARATQIETAEERAVREEQLSEAQRNFDRFLIPAGIVLLIVMGLALWSANRGSSARAEAVEANASAMANLLETEADRLDAMANDAGGARP